MPANPLFRLMNPSSIATVGAGNNFFKMGSLHALSIINDGYSGKFYPVHPTDEKVLGHVSFKSVKELPEPPDLALLIVPSKQVAGLLEDFGRLGTKTAIIISAGFAETGEGGAAMQHKLNEISAAYGIRFLGPNCMGIINTGISLNTTVIPYNLGPGSLGFASQSGTYVTQTIVYLGKRGIRFSKAISVGNSANIDITDALEYLGDDEQTKAISLYIEGINDIPRFVKVARRITPYKPVLAQYIGGSDAGARSGLSHTGTMAAPDHLYEGLFEQAGIIRVHSVEDLYCCGNMLAVQPPLAGNRIGVVTNSGGPGSAIANALERGGLRVPEFSPALQQKIRENILPYAPCGNPVDLTFHTDMEVMAVKIPDLILSSGEVDGIIMHGVMSTGFAKALSPHMKGLMSDETMGDFISQATKASDHFATVARPHHKPMAVSSFFDRDDNCTSAYEDSGVPVFDSPEKTAGGMICMLKHLRVRERKPWSPAPVQAPAARASSMISACLAAGRRNLDEHESKLFLQYYDIPVVRSVLVHTEDELAQAAEELGYPLVIKASSHEVLHKTGKGLIYLNQNSKDGMIRSFRKIREITGKNTPALVERMTAGEREFVAGIVRSKGFGPSVMFGLGGIFTEALGDAVFRPAPISKEDAYEMVQGIRARKLLSAIRGMPAVNISSLASLLHRLSTIPIVHPEVSEIDINPVIIESADPVAVDALVLFD